MYRLHIIELGLTDCVIVAIILVVITQVDSDYISSNNTGRSTARKIKICYCDGNGKKRIMVIVVKQTSIATVAILVICRFTVCLSLLQLPFGYIALLMLHSAGSYTMLHTFIL